MENTLSLFAKRIHVFHELLREFNHLSVHKYFEKHIFPSRHNVRLLHKFTTSQIRNTPRTKYCFLYCLLSPFVRVN